MSLNHSTISSTATALLEKLHKGEQSSAEITQSFLDRISAHDKTIGAFLRVDADAALDGARQIDERRAAGKELGLLAGLPVAVKDVLCTSGEVTTCGSRILENFKPPYDATVIEKLRAADAVLIGKTNMDEFAMGSSTENSAYQPTRNPWDQERIPGGSSGGAAACVAAGMAPLSIGTDTGGSIRQPAALCGVTGMKPTYGRVSRYGLVAFASSLDQVGPLAGSVEDTALLLQAISGYDPRDSTSANQSVPPFSQTVSSPLGNFTLGVVREHFAEGLDEEIAAAVQQAIEIFRSQGAKIKDVSLPHSKYGIATYYIIAPCEASSNLARFDGAHYGRRTDEKEMLAELEAERKALEAAGDSKALDDLDTPLVRMYRRTRSEGFGAEVKRRIMLGTYALSKGYYDAYYVKALKVRRLIRRDFDQAFGEVDFLIGPTTPAPAYNIGEKSGDPLAMYLGDLYTVLANLAGVPAISLPCGFTSSPPNKGLPIGVQLQAPPFEEQRLLQAAYLYQQATEWHTQKAELT